MNLTRGITGGWCRGDTPPPFVPFDSFRDTVWRAAGWKGYAVVECDTGEEPARSYYSAVLQPRDSARRLERYRVYCNRHYRFWAVTSNEDHASRPLALADAPDLAEALSVLSGGRALTAAELLQSFRIQDHPDLGEAELKDIRYWEPATVGDVIFNCWD